MMLGSMASNVGADGATVSNVMVRGPAGVLNTPSPSTETPKKMFGPSWRLTLAANDAVSSTAPISTGASSLRCSLMPVKACLVPSMSAVATLVKESVVMNVGAFRAPSTRPVHSLQPAATASASTIATTRRAVLIMVVSIAGLQGMQGR